MLAKICGWAIWTGVVVSLSVSRTAWAQTPASLISIEYMAPVGCPDAATFVSLVEARTPLSRHADREDPRFVVSIRDEGVESVGNLTIEGPGGRRATRDVGGQTCREVADALAFVIAVAIDPGLGDATRGLDDKTATKSVAPEAPPADARAPVTESAAEGKRDGSWRLFAGVSGAANAWVLPGVNLALPIFVEAEQMRGGQRLAASLSLIFEESASNTVRASGAGAAQFQSTIGRARVCPQAWALAPTLNALACVGLDAGVLSAQGEEIAGKRSQQEPWFATRFAGRFMWLPFDVLFVDVEVGALVPLSRYRFYFEPDNTVYEPPIAGGFGSLSIGLRFL